MKRRKLLKGFGHLAMSSSYFYGLQALLDTCIRANIAQAATKSEISYVNIQIPGAPPRWMFDQPLNPNNRGADFKPGQFGTEIVKAGNTFNAVHRGHKVNFGGKDYWLPPVWNLTSAKLGLPLRNLLDHSLMVRGIDMEINSHIVNRQRMVRPVASQPSIHGLVADKSDRPIAASGARGTQGTVAFNSESGQSIVQVPQNDPVPSLIQAFQGPITKVSELPYEVTDIVDALDKLALDRGMSSLGSEKQQMAAFKMFEKNLGKFKEQWQGIYNRYRGIIQAEIRANFPGVNEQNPIGTNAEKFRHNRGNSFVQGSLKAKVTNSTRINGMAQAFAFAEFALVEKLSSSLSVSTGGNVMTGLAGIGRIVADQHFVGSVTSVFYTSLFYRALASCLLELTERLKEAGEFDHTVLHVMSEFSRTPKASGGGSDHGFNGTSAMIISGMIEQPGLIGNIAKESQSASMRTRYPGTWGEAAPLFASEGRKLVNDDVVQTLCEMLEIRKVAVKGVPLVKKSGGKVTWTGDWGVKNV